MSQLSQLNRGVAAVRQHDEGLGWMDRSYLGAMRLVPRAFKRTIQLRRHVIQQVVVLVDNAHCWSTHLLTNYLVVAVSR
jgi:hypothetical protein